MKTIEIAEIIKQSNPDKLGKMSDKKIAMIIKLALQQLGKQLEEMDEGKVQVAGLGNFIVKQVTSEKDGQTETSKRITFRPAKPKSNSGESGDQAQETL